MLKLMLMSVNKNKYIVYAFNIQLFRKTMHYIKVQGYCYL